MALCVCVKGTKKDDTEKISKYHREKVRERERERVWKGHYEDMIIVYHLVIWTNIYSTTEHCWYLCFGGDTKNINIKEKERGWYNVYDIYHCKISARKARYARINKQT